MGGAGGGGVGAYLCGRPGDRGGHPPAPTMRRARGLAIGVLALALMTCFAAEAEQPGKIARIGYLLTGSLDSSETRAALGAFREGLRERGYVEGQNIVIEYRTAEGRIERFPELARELVGLKVDLIVAGATPTARGARQAT